MLCDMLFCSLSRCDARLQAAHTHACRRVNCRGGCSLVALPATTPASGSPLLHTATSAWPHPWCSPNGSHTSPLTQQHLPHTTSAMQRQRSMPLSTHASTRCARTPTYSKTYQPQQLNMPASSLVHMAVPLIGNTRCSHLLGCLQLGVANTASCLVSHVAKSALD